MTSIILASGSRHRRTMLENAGLDFNVVPSTIDERSVEASLQGSDVTPDDVAAILSEAKAVEVSERSAGSFVIGADQTLSLDDEILHKPATMEDARRTLLRLSGRTHRLHSAYTIAQDGVVRARRVETATIAFRELTPPQIGQYLARAGAVALTSVGAYQVEGPGIQLMDAIEGDFFTIIGLPLLPLLQDLRELGAIDG